jgi:CcmD family protein
MSQGQYVAGAYGVVFVVVLAYVAIIASKLSRIQRQLADLLELATQRRAHVVEPEPVARTAVGKPS